MFSLLIYSRASRTHWSSESPGGTSTFFREYDDSLRLCVIYRGSNDLTTKARNYLSFDQKVFKSVRSGPAIHTARPDQYILVDGNSQRQWTEIDQAYSPDKSLIHFNVETKAKFVSKLPSTRTRSQPRIHQRPKPYYRFQLWPEKSLCHSVSPTQRGFSCLEFPGLRFISLRCNKRGVPKPQRLNLRWLWPRCVKLTWFETRRLQFRKLVAV